MCRDSVLELLEHFNVIMVGSVREMNVNTPNMDRLCIPSLYCVYMYIGVFLFVGLRIYVFVYICRLIVYMCGCVFIVLLTYTYVCFVVAVVVVVVAVVVVAVVVVAVQMHVHMCTRMPVCVGIWVPVYVHVYGSIMDLYIFNGCVQHYEDTICVIFHYSH